MIEQDAAQSQARGIEDARTESVPAPVRWGLLALVLAIVAAVYWRGLAGEFVYDDLWLVGRNPAIHSLERLPEAFVRAHWDVADPAQAARVGYWRPLTSVALFTGYALGGGDPPAFHVVSLVCHLAAIALAFLLALRLTRSTPAALATALLFGLHPVQVEAVSWISAVNDPLSGAFCLAALLAHLRWRERGSRGWPLATAPLFALGLLAKESAIAFLPLVLALDAGRPVAAGEARFRPVWRAFAPALGVLVLYWLARIAVFGDAFAGFDRITSHLDATFAREITLRIELIGGALALLVAPLRLNLFREVRPEVTATDAAVWLGALALVLWVLATSLAWRRRSRLVLAALLVMLAGIAPAFVRIESIGRFPLSERFLYLSVFGVALLATTCAMRWLARLPALTLLALLALASGLKSHARTAFWADEESVFRASAAASPRSMYVQWGLGRVLLDKFRRTSDLATLDEANRAALAAQDLWSTDDPSVLRTNDDILQANLEHGWCQILCALHRPDECSLGEAELVFGGIVERFADSPAAYCGLGVAQRLQGKLVEAEAAFRRALELNPRHHESWFALAQMLIEQRRWSDALAAFDRCVQLEPDDVVSLLQLAKAAIELDAMDRARQALSRVRRLEPENPDALIQLGVLAARERRFDQAVEFAESALKLDGAHGEAHLLRANALVQAGQVSRAIEAYQDAIRWLQEPALDPTRPAQLFEALFNLSQMLIELGQGPQAVPFLEMALALEPEGARADELRRQLELFKPAPK